MLFHNVSLRNPATRITPKSSRCTRWAKELYKTHERLLWLIETWIRNGGRLRESNYLLSPYSVCAILKLERTVMIMRTSKGQGWPGLASVSRVSPAMPRNHCCLTTLSATLSAAAVAEVKWLAIRWGLASCLTHKWWQSLATWWIRSKPSYPWYSTCP